MSSNNMCELCFGTLQKDQDIYFEELNTERLLCPACFDIIADFNEKMRIRRIFFGNDSHYVRRNK